MSDTPVDWDDMQGVTFTVEVRVQPNDPSYGLWLGHQGLAWIRSDSHLPDGGEDVSSEILSPESLARVLADRLVGRDFDSLWTIAAVRPAPQ